MPPPLSAVLPAMVVRMMLGCADQFIATPPPLDRPVLPSIVQSMIVGLAARVARRPPPKTAVLPTMRQFAITGDER